MAKLRIIGETLNGQKMNFVSHSNLSKIPGCDMFFRPQTKNACIIPDDALLEGK